MPLNPVYVTRKFHATLFFSDTSDLNGTCHLKPFMPLEYFLPLKNGGNDTLASPARSLSHGSVESFKSYK